MVLRYAHHFDDFFVVGVVKFLLILVLKKARRAP